MRMETNMADELVEPQEIVPENAESFTQSVVPEEAPPEPAPIPEPVVEAAPEPELPPVEPDWLSAPAQPEPPPQQYQPDYNYQQQPPQQQYPQQPQVPQYGTPDAALQTFVDNPDGWADQKIEQRLAARDQQIAQQNQAIQNMTGMLMQDRMTEAVTGANAAVQRAYTVFNKDTSFRSNKDMQRSLQATLQGMRQKAEYEARTTGNFEPLRTLSNLSESDMEATLAYMKVKAGTQSPGTGPLQVEGATVESSRSAVAGQTAELPEEFREIANRLGPRGEARLLKQIQVTADADDFEG
jgi:hypothetical protein